MKPREIEIHFKHALGTPKADDEFWLTLRPDETIRFVESLPDHLMLSREKVMLAVEMVLYERMIEGSGGVPEEVAEKLFGAQTPDAEGRQK